MSFRQEETRLLSELGFLDAKTFGEPVLSWSQNPERFVKEVHCIEARCIDGQRDQGGIEAMAGQLFEKSGSHLLDDDEMQLGKGALEWA